MKTIEITSPASIELAIREGQEEDVVVLQNGKPVALVVPFDEDDLAFYAAEHDPKFIKSIARAREQIRAGNMITQEQLEKELGL